MKRKTWAAVWLLFGFLMGSLSAAEVMPSRPDRYFNDYTHTVSSSTAQNLNERLANFERETSNQILVAIYSTMQSDSDMADYTQRLAQSWGVGQKDKNNGAVLFVFKDDRKMFLQVGYGLEGVLPDALAKQIIEDEIKPHFKAGQFDAGVSSGVDAILRAARGEYHGSGRTVRESRDRKSANGFVIFLFIMIFILIALGKARSGRRGRYYRSSGYGWYGGGWGGGGGSSSSGGGFSGFSGGGGSFGGGGAGGSW